MINRSFFGSSPKPIPSGIFFSCQIWWNFFFGDFSFVIFSLSWDTWAVSVRVQTETYQVGNKILTFIFRSRCVSYSVRLLTPLTIFLYILNKNVLRKRQKFLSKAIRNNELFCCYALRQTQFSTKGTKLHCLLVMKYKKLRITWDGSKKCFA